MAELLLIAADEWAAARTAEELVGAQTLGRVVISSSAPACGDVRVFTADDRPTTDDLASLAPAELLFVEAWQTRLDGPPKVRPGDGRPWDEPGFQPPDPAYHDDG